MPPLPVKRTRRNGSSILRGILRLGRGQAAGIAEFGNTSDALTASLAPLIAFPLVGSAMLAASGQPGPAAIAFLSRLCGVLALPLITQLYARITRRDEFWLRTATALNWSFWILIPLLLVGAFFGAVLVTAKVDEHRAEQIVIVILALYMLWLHWFIVRTGLRLAILPAAGLVVVSNIAVGVLTFAPDLVDFILRKPG